MGPDEFHDGYPDNPGGGLNDNAYVNTLTSWMLARTLDVYRLLSGHHVGDLWERLQLGDRKLDRVQRF
jgi:trehalose/maltose hydrolase-like predicted phosphorylase